MMDWTDTLNSLWHISDLRRLKSACHLYGTTNFGCLRWFAKVCGPGQANPWVICGIRSRSFRVICPGNS